MKRVGWSKTRALLAGVALIAVTNAIVLGGVVFNRHGEAQSTLMLTERELPIARRGRLDNDNGAIDLEVRWRIRRARGDEPYRASSYAIEWLSEADVRKLGFDVPESPELGRSGRHKWNPLSRAAFVVLEKDGAAYQAALDAARRALEREIALASANPGVEEFAARVATARRALAAEATSASRLFVIDIGADPQELRERYPDRARYAIVRASVRAHVQGRTEPLQTVVYVSALEIETISVPHSLRSIVEPFAPLGSRKSQAARAPRYQATVRYGRRLEPWVTEVSALR